MAVNVDLSALPMFAAERVFYNKAAEPRVVEDNGGFDMFSDCINVERVASGNGAVDDLVHSRLKEKAASRG